MDIPSRQKIKKTLQVRDWLIHRWLFANSQRFSTGLRRKKKKQLKFICYLIYFIWNRAPIWNNYTYNNKVCNTAPQRVRSVNLVILTKLTFDRLIWNSFVLIVYRLFLLANGEICSHAPVKDTQQSFIWGGFARGPKPLPFDILFLTEKVALFKWYLFHIPTVETLHPFTTFTKLFAWVAP